MSQEMMMSFILSPCILDKAIFPFSVNYLNPSVPILEIADLQARNLTGGVGGKTKWGLEYLQLYF